jgi:hypothetical protein
MRNVTRRGFLQRAGRGAAALALPEWARAQGGRKPNIVFFIADDMDADLFNFRPEGRGKNLTPNLDRLAAEGTILWEQHIVSPVCTPSRYCCLTGRCASRARNAAFRQTTERAGQTIVTWNANIVPEDTTLPGLLQKAGYVTGMVGKNHVVEAPGRVRIPADADPRDPAVVGRLKENARRTRDAIRACGFDDGASIYPSNAEANGPDPLCVHNMDWIARGGVDFIEQNKDRPLRSGRGTRTRWRRRTGTWTSRWMSCRRARPCPKGWGRRERRRTPAGRWRCGWTRRWVRSCGNWSGMACWTTRSSSFSTTTVRRAKARSTSPPRTPRAWAVRPVDRPARAEEPREGSRTRRQARGDEARTAKAPGSAARWVRGDEEAGAVERSSLSC